MTKIYKYYERTSGVAVWELYRCPANDLPLFEQPLSEIQKASQHQSWMSVKNINGLWEENLTGWFDESNEINAEEAEAVLLSWVSPPS